jgi:tetratricopeptide (TPR) repeat protein
VELPADIGLQLDDLCERGRALEEAGDFRAAIRAYLEADALLPPPREGWDAAWWLDAAVGDCHFQLLEFEDAEVFFRRAMVEGELIGNAFVRLRRGQVLLELGRDDEALEELAAAYMLEGRELFEEDDPKYFAFVKQNLKPPAGGEW